MTIETKEKGKETKIAMKGNSEVAEQEVDLEEEAVAANNITVDGLRTNVKYTENTNGPIAERTQRETIMIRTQKEADEAEPRSRSRLSRPRQQWRPWRVSST